MSVDSLISIEPVQRHCMHAWIKNILLEGVVREDRNATKNGPPSAHQRNAIVDNGWLDSFVIFGGSGSILLGNPIFLRIFRGGPDPLPPPPPSGSAHGMHLKEGTCLKCSFQRQVIIGRKVDSWYACLPLSRHAGQSSGSKLQTLKAGRKRERERELERDCKVFAHESIVLAWFLRIPKRNVCVSQSIL